MGVRESSRGDQLKAGGPLRMELTSAGVFRRYEEVRLRLPAMPVVADTRTGADFSEIASDFDVFFFDAFGVLNIGDTVISGAPERIAALKAEGKSTYVVTNAATQDGSALFRKYAAMGFDFTPDEIVSSRAILLSSLIEFPEVTQWAAMLPGGGSHDGLPANIVTIESDPDRFWSAEGYLFLSSKDWDSERQERLVSRLNRRPAPVLVGNPDLVAPREHGLSKEPGFFAHDILDRTDCPARFFGKPFGNAFDAAKAAAARHRGALKPKRIAMVGDTLHTDILGGAAAGIRTVLVTDHGVLKGHDACAYIEASGIRPDFIVRSL